MGFMAIVVIILGLAINLNRSDSLDNLAITPGVPLPTNFLTDSPLRDYYVRQLAVTWGEPRHGGSLWDRPHLPSLHLRNVLTCAGNTFVLPMGPVRASPTA
jgi:hypothetical protein